MKRLLPILMLCASNLCMGDDPYQLYDFTTMIASNVQLKVHPVDNVKAACEYESRKRHTEGFGNLRLQACSFWSPVNPDTNVCDIYVPRYTNHETIGHEVHHCIQGAFHP
jgi:hypothetical protein